MRRSFFRGLLPVLFLAVLLGDPAVQAANLPSRISADDLKPLLAVLERSNPEDQLWAIDVLGEMGPSAQKSSGALIKLIRSGKAEVRVAAALALMKVDPDTKDFIPILIGALDKQMAGQLKMPLEMAGRTDVMGLEEDILQKWAGLTRRDIGPKIVPYLAREMKAQDKDIRLLALLVLANLSEKIPAAFSLVLNGLNDPDPEVRICVIGALERIEGRKSEIAPALVRAFGDPEKAVRVRVVQALGKMGPAAQNAVPSLVRVLKSTNSGEQLQAAEALFQVDPSAALQAVPVLLNFLRDPNPEVRSRSIVVLGKIGRPVLPALESLLKDRNPVVRSGALEVLLRLSLDKEQIVPYLIAALKDPDRSVRYAATEGLERMGQAAESAIPDLISLLTDSELGIRASAGKTLLKLGAAAVPALTRASESEDPTLRSRSTFLLNQIRSERQ